MKPIPLNRYFSAQRRASSNDPHVAGSLGDARRPPFGEYGTLQSRPEGPGLSVENLAKWDCEEGKNVVQ